MSYPYRIFSKRKLVSIGVSVMMATTTIGITAVNIAPTAAYAATQTLTAQQQTNLNEFTNLVNDLNNLNTSLQSQGTLSQVQGFGDSLYGNSPTVTAAWIKVLYGSSSTVAPATQLAAVKFIQDMMSFVFPTPSSPFATLTATTTSEHSVTSTINQDLSGIQPAVSVTGTDLYNFYESFRSAFLQNLMNNVGGSGQSLTANILAPALESAVNANQEFRGILGDFGLSVSQIPTYRLNFTNTFTSGSSYGIGATAALNDIMAASFNIRFNSVNISNNTLPTLTSGNSGLISLSPGSDTGSFLQNITIPNSWYNLTSSNTSVATVTPVQNSSSWSLNAVGPGTAQVTVTRGNLQLGQFNVNVAGSTGSGGTVTPPPVVTPPSGGSTPPTQPTDDVTGVVGQPLNVAALGSNGTQIQANVDAQDVTKPIQVTLQALTSLPTNMTPINNVLQAIDLSALLPPTSGSGGVSTPVNYFSQPVSITFTLTAPPTTPIAIVFWNRLTNAWQPVANFSVNQNTITMTTTHFTTFAVTSASSVQSVNRIAGQLALDTAIQAAESAYPDGASSVVLAFAGNKLPSPDALSAAGLAGSLHAPLLLTEQNTLDPAVLKAIQTLGAKTVYVLGGPHAIGDTVVNALAQAGLNVVRNFEGQTLYDTSLMIDQYMYQNKLTSAQTAFIANGQTMIDALSASPVAYQQNAPIMLVKTGQGQLTSSQLAFLQSAGIKKVVLLGGTYVVSGGIESQMAQTFGSANVLRLGGRTMNDTAVAIDQNYFPNATGAVISSNGTPTGTFVDALSASAFAANNNVPILLTNSTGLPASTTQYLGSQKTLHAIWVMGGPQAVAPSLDQTLTANIQSTN